MALYKVVLNGNSVGQDVKNILYYRSGIGVEIGGLGFGGTLELGNAVKAMVWPKMKNVLTANYTLQDITTYVYEDGTFNLIYQNPVTVSVGEQGARPGETNGPAVCAIAKFQLEPTIIVTNGIKPPKRGYLAIGPLIDNQVTSGGRLNTSDPSQQNWDELASALGGNVEQLLPVPFIWFPVRVHTDTILGVLKIASYADVSGVTWRDRTSYRRSRQPEA